MHTTTLTRWLALAVAASILSSACGADDPGTPLECREDAECDDGIGCTADACSLDGACVSTPVDGDEDGHPDRACLDRDGSPFGDDCDDGDPSSTTVDVDGDCDGVVTDDDCDDDDPSSETVLTDADCDGFLDDVDPPVCATLGTASRYDGPVPTLAWGFDDDTLDDSTLPHSDGTALGAVSPSPGIFGRGGWMFDASDGTRIESGELEKRTLFTIVAWVRARSYTAEYGSIVDVGNGPGPHEGVVLAVEESGELSIQTRNGSVDGDVVTVARIVVPLDQWVHVAATFDGEMVRLYQDSAEVAAEGRAYVELDYGTESLAVGDDRLLDGHGFDGQIDEVAYWNTALSPSELAQLVEAQCNGAALAAEDANSCAAPTAVAAGTPLPTPDLYWTFDDADISDDTLVDRAGAFDAIVGTGATPGADGLLAEAMSFDRGARLASTVSSDAYDAVDDFTLSVWLNIATLGGDGPRGTRWIGGSGNGPNNVPICTGWATSVSSSQVRFATYLGETASDCNALERAATRQCVVTDDWLHIVGVLDTAGDRIRIYRNGRLEDVAGLGGRTPSYAAMHSLHVGGPLFTDQGDRYFDGLQDELAIYHSALSDDEVRELYARGATGMSLPTP